eukprot:UN25045
MRLQRIRDNLRKLKTENQEAIIEIKRTIGGSSSIPREEAPRDRRGASMPNRRKYDSPDNFDKDYYERIRRDMKRPIDTHLRPVKVLQGRSASIYDDSVEISRRSPSFDRRIGGSVPPVRKSYIDKDVLRTRINNHLDIRENHRYKRHTYSSRYDNDHDYDPDYYARVRRDLHRPVDDHMSNDGDDIWSRKRPLYSDIGNFRRPKRRRNTMDSDNDGINSDDDLVPNSIR